LSSLRKENIKKKFCKDGITKEMKNVIKDVKNETIESGSLKNN